MRACVLAEGLGMAVAAGAARVADSMTPGPAFLVVLAGGLVEGSVLGVLQARALRDLLGRRQGGWALVTVTIAGLGWAAGSAKSTLGADNSGTPPPLTVIFLGAAALGAGMGALLGVAQGAVLRHRVRHPWRWVTANAAAWSVAMPVVFIGATTADPDWSWGSLVLFGGATGALAGGALGLVSSVWFETFDSLPLRHRAVLRLLERRRRPAQSGWTGLGITGRRSGRIFRFPVMSAPMGHNFLVVVPGNARRKTWWRQLGPTSSIEVLDEGRWRPASAQLLVPGTIEWSVARSAYVSRWPRAAVETEQPLVVVDLQTQRS